MKRNDVFAIVIIVLIVFGIAIWIATSSDEKPVNQTSSNNEDKSANFFQKIADRLEQMRNEVDAELEKLRLTVEMQQFVDKKINFYLRAAKIILGVILLSIFGAFIYNGVEVLTATFATSGIVCLAIPVFTYFFFTQVMDVKEFVSWMTHKIKIAVFKKYGFDPSTIHEMEKSIAIKTGIWKGLQKELNNEL